MSSSSKLPPLSVVGHSLYGKALGHQAQQRPAQTSGQQKSSLQTVRSLAREALAQEPPKPKTRTVGTSFHPIMKGPDKRIVSIDDYIQMQAEELQTKTRLLQEAELQRHLLERKVRYLEAELQQRKDEVFLEEVRAMIARAEKLDS